MINKIILLVTISFAFSFLSEIYGHTIQLTYKDLALSEDTQKKVPEDNKEKEFKVWVSYKHICVRTLGNEGAIVSVTNVLGQDVFNKQLLPYDQQCTSELSNGIYIISFRPDRGGFYTRKLIVR